MNAGEVVRHRRHGAQAVPEVGVRQPGERGLFHRYDRSGAAKSVDETHLARNLAGAQNGEDDWCSVRMVNLNFDCAVEDDIGDVTWLFGREDGGARGEGTYAQEIMKLSLLGQRQSAKQGDRLEVEGIEERRHASSPPTGDQDPAIGDRCSAWGASAPEDSISLDGAS